MSNAANHDAIEKHYREYYSRLVKKYTRAAGTVWDAEDVVQTAFERAIRYHSPDVEFIITWFDNIVRTCLIDFLNESRGIVLEELDEFDHEAVSTIDPIQFRLTLEKLINEEPQDHKPILELHFIKGYSAIEIYHHNAFSYPNTRKIIQRFRDKVKKEIQTE